jgi:hypothetical protein
MAAMLLAACSGSGAAEEAAAEPRAVPVVQSEAARALRLPRMRVASVSAGVTGAPLRVHVVVDGAMPPDTTIQVRNVDAACGESFIDTTVVHSGTSVAGALVWIDASGGAAVTMQPAAEHRPTVVLEGCRLGPRVQVAAPGSTLQLVTRDSRVESLVVVPVSPAAPIDTVSFNTDGQLVPLRQRADSTGVVAIFATRLPWARAFIAVATPGTAGVTDLEGITTFSIASGARKISVRAWHPTLGIATGSITPAGGTTPAELTLTFKR